MKRLVSFAALLLLAVAARAQQPDAATYQLKPTPKTVAWGYYDASTPPVLRIKSGDTVEVQTLITSSPTRLEGAGVKPEDVEQTLRDIYKEVTNKGPGGHILTGPIFIEGAEPGDVLEVRIKQIKLAIPYAYNAFSPGRGFLPEDFPYAKMRIIPLDEKRMVAHFADGIEIPLHPFFGSIGVAPPDVSGRISSAPPWIHAGNLDNKELVAGTTLYIPIHAKGALFLAGDGHAAQGNGDKNDVITLERGPCFGPCPIYKVSLASDGTISFEGFNFVSTKGKATAQIRPQDFQKLVAEFEKMKYFSLDENYTIGTPGCGGAVTDMPS